MLMKFASLSRRCGWFAAAAALLPAAAFAESIAASSASSASLTASSASESLGASSNSSKGGNTARAGDYRIEAVTAADQPDRVRVALGPLKPAPDRQGFVLTLPRAVLEAQALARGDTVSVRDRPYGYEFAHGRSKQAFFLVLADDWMRELEARPLTKAVTAASI
jgi:hypothetical protein